MTLGALAELSEVVEINLPEPYLIHVAVLTFCYGKSYEMELIMQYVTIVLLVQRVWFFSGPFPIFHVSIFSLESRCPPCKAIAPVFEKLSTENTKEGQLAFAKIDVDAQKQIAGKYKISAMPTFLLLSSEGVPLKMVRGADAKGIKALISYANKKVAGEQVSEEEEKAHDPNVAAEPGQ